MNNVTNLFEEERGPVCIGYMVVKSVGGWKLFAVLEDGTYSEWFEGPNLSKIYQNLDDACAFLTMAGLDRFMVRTTPLPPQSIRQE